MRHDNAVPLEAATPFAFIEPEPRRPRTQAIRITRPISADPPAPADAPHAAPRAPTSVDACDCLTQLARFLIWATRNTNR